MKEYMKNQVQKFKDSSFPVTMAAIWTATGLAVIWGWDDIWLEDAVFFLFFFGLGSFLTEAVFLRRKKGIPGLAGFGGAAVLAAFFTVWRHFRWEIGWESWDARFERYAVGYVLFLLSLGIYICYRFGSRRGMFTFGGYLVRVFGSCLRVSLIYTVLMFGSLMIAAAADMLFDAVFDMMMRVQFLIFGLYYMPSLPSCVFPEKEEKSPLTEFLVKYVLTGMTACAFAVVYLYMLKILITFEMPSNEIFRIVAGLFVLGFPVCLMDDCFPENNPFRKVSAVLVCLMPPLVLMQLFSIAVRIREHGLTPMRYVCVMFLLFEVLTLVLYFVKRTKLGTAIGAIPVLIAVSCFLPFINMDYTSYLSQKAALEAVLSLPEEKKEALSAEAYESMVRRAKGAYEYLKYNDYAADYMAASRELAEEALACLPKEQTQPYYQEQETPDVFTVSGYDRIYPLRITVNRDIEDADSAVLLLQEEIHGKEVRLETRQFLEPYMEHADENHDFSEYFRTHNSYQVTDTYRLVLEDLAFRRDVERKVVTHFYIKGYLLEKTGVS